MPGTSVISLSEGPMNQAILFANSALKSCIERAAGGAPECLPFMFILFCLSILSIALAALTMPAQRLRIKRIRQKIGRIGITARVRFSLNCRWRRNDAKAKTRKLRT
jgi:hypothetical protein